MNSGNQSTELYVIRYTRRYIAETRGCGRGFLNDASTKALGEIKGQFKPQLHLGALTIRLKLFQSRKNLSVPVFSNHGGAQNDKPVREKVEKGQGWGMGREEWRGEEREWQRNF